MTGSPVLKLDHDLSKKQKSHRKLSFSNDVPEDNSCVVGRGSNIVADRKKSISSFSSHVFAEKRGVKRKLDFDVDDASDTETSFRFSNRHFNIGGFQSRNSSLIDIKSIVSPNKIRPRGCYSHSSIGSTCRRRLFADNEPDSKRSKLESPLIRSKTKNEVRLSLKKKFPGVPNSDSARSGLLLNLAFSKYNLSNIEKSDNNVTFDFINHGTIKTTKKGFVQYSSIEKADLSHSYSPVFTAIKKVKRKLNLEDQENNSESVECRKPMLENSENNHKIAAIHESKENNKNSTGGHIIGLDDSENNMSGVVGGNNSDATPDAPSENQKTIFQNEGNNQMCSPPLFSKPSSNRYRKNDLFMNSKIRSSLRDKIFNLSKWTSSSNNNNSSKDNLNFDPKMPTSIDSRFTSSTLDENCRTKNRRLSCDHKKVLETSKSKQNVKYDRIVIKRDLVERTKKDAAKFKRLNSTLSSHSSTKARKRWINDSFEKGSGTKCNKTSKGRGSFIESHIQRFLDDCLYDIKCQGREAQSMDISMADVPISETESESSQNDSKIPKVDEKVEEHSQKAPGVEFVIEGQSSQEISKQNEIFIENDPQGCFPPVANDSPGDCNTTLGFTKKCRIFEDTLGESEITNTIKGKEILIDSASEADTPDVGYTVEEISTSSSVDKEFINVEVNYGCDTPCKSADRDQNITLSSRKIRKRMKINPEALSTRLKTLINREKSEARIWEYEVIERRTNKPFLDVQNSVAVFCVEKMWKEFSQLIIVCSVVNQDVPDHIYNVSEAMDIGLKISKTVVIIMESDSCPKTLNYSCTFRVHPPWRILQSEKIYAPIILRPCKVEILSEKVKMISSRNPSLPKESCILSDKKFCSCSDLTCDCPISEGYQTVISALLILTPQTSCLEMKTYTIDDFENPSSIDDIVLKYKFCSTDSLFLDLRVLHVYKGEAYNDFGFWYVICKSETSEVCGILIQDEMKKTMSNVNTEIKFRFFGLVPWKYVPTIYVPKFIELVKLKEHDDLTYNIETNGIQFFVLSEKCGLIKRL